MTFPATRFAITLTGCLVLVACERPVPTDPVPDAALTSGPAIPGESHLIRIGVQEWTLSTADPVAELFTIYGDPTEIFDCGGDGGPEFSVQFNELELTMGRMRNLVSQGRDIPIYVYDFFGPEDLMGRTFCEYFAEEWKYRGTVNFAEIFHRNLVQNNTAWHWKSTGSLSDVNGAPYRFLENQLFVRSSGGFASWINESIKVTPGGGS